MGWGWVALWSRWNNLDQFSNDWLFYNDSRVPITFHFQTILHFCELALLPIEEIDSFCMRSTKVKLSKYILNSWYDIDTINIYYIELISLCQNSQNSLFEFSLRKRKVFLLNLTLALAKKISAQGRNPRLQTDMSRKVKVIALSVVFTVVFINIAIVITLHLLSRSAKNTME